MSDQLAAALSGDVRVLLCDADGNLFPSEEPAFDASAEVTNDFLASMGVRHSYTSRELRIATTGKNFRATALDLCRLHNVPVHPELSGPHPARPLTGRQARGRKVLSQVLLDGWVKVEQQTVSKHLGAVLRPDPGVGLPLTELARHLTLAAVSSSAIVRLATCFAATALTDLFPPDLTFSAEDSLPIPTSKPDPAIYQLAGERLGCTGPQALAIEDSLAGARSAVAAGFPTVGNLQFVPPDERAKREAALIEAGVLGVVGSWSELADAVLSRLRCDELATSPSKSY